MDFAPVLLTLRVGVAWVFAFENVTVTDAPVYKAKFAQVAAFACVPAAVLEVAYAAFLWLISVVRADCFA